MATALHLPTEHALGHRRTAHLVSGARARHAHAPEHLAQVGLCVREATVSGLGGGTGRGTVRQRDGTEGGEGRKVGQKEKERGTDRQE